jgi:hypothetical protein
MTIMSKEKLPIGGYKIPIDWNEVDELLMAGCNGTQVAAWFDVHHDTIYNRCKEEKGVSWSVYSLKKREKGNSVILKAQFKVAKEGDKTMLIWLGKQRCEQREPEAKQSELSLPSLVVYMGDLKNKKPDTTKEVVDDITGPIS